MKHFRAVVGLFYGGGALQKHFFLAHTTVFLKACYASKLELGGMDYSPQHLTPPPLCDIVPGDLQIDDCELHLQYSSVDRYAGKIEKKGATMDNYSKPIKNVTIVGAGFMGTLIGFHCAVKGYSVCLHDASTQALEKVMPSCAEKFDFLVANQAATANEKDNVIRQIRLARDIKRATLDTDLVIEAVPERLELKREVFAGLDQVCPAHTILATNSSSIPISRIEGATRRPDRVLNMHFYVPVRDNAVVELMRGTATSDHTIEQARQFVHSIGLIPILAQKESFGFVLNRIWRAVKKECLRVVDEGVASVEDVDQAWQAFLGTAYGPFFMMDVIGLDVVHDIEMSYYRESGDASDAPPKILLDKIAAGELGVKTGKGFYTY
jgi:3-hydroxybutyryl-CoA dehydrogenase